MTKKEYRKQYYLAHRDRWKAYYATRKSLPNHKKDACKIAMRYYYRHRDKIVGTRNEYLKDYFRKNKDIIKQKQREYVRAHREEHNARSRAWKRKNKIKASLMSKRYEEKHKEKIKARKKIYRASHLVERNLYKHKRRAIQLGATLGDPKQIIEYMYSVKACPKTACYYCGVSLFGKTIHFDHILPLVRGGAHSVENLCAACPDCNLSKASKTVEEFQQWRMEMSMMRQLLESKAQSETKGVLN